jgi:RNA polymerase sigma factor (sigma-70 family)
MGPREAAVLLRHVRRQVGGPAAEAGTDRALIERFAAGDEAAFALLVRRHGSMVFRVCRHILDNAEDAEDAFQATFLVLARKATALTWQGSLGGWLYAVASRAARKARTTARRRRAHESLAPARPPADGPGGEIDDREARAVVLEELNRLPEKLRSPLVLCYLEGKSQSQAAQQAGWSFSTLKRRLRQGLKLMQGRLQRRGLTLGAVVSFGLEDDLRLAAPALLEATTRAGALFRAGPAAGARPGAAALAEGLLKTMSWGRARSLAALLLAAVLGLGGGLLAYRALAKESPEQPGRPAEKVSAPLRPHLPLAMLPVARPGLGRLQLDGTPLGVAFAPKGSLVAGCGGPPDNTLRLWDAATGQEQWRRPLGCGANAVAFSPNGEALAVACDDRTVRLHDAVTGRELRRFVGHQGRVTCLVFTRDRQVLISGGLDGTVREWGLRTGAALRRWSVPGRAVHCLALSPDGTLLTAGCAGPPPGHRGQVSRWELPSGKERPPFPYNPLGVQALAFSPSGRALAAAGISGHISLYDPWGRGDRGTAIDHNAVARNLFLPAALAFSPDGTVLACGCRSGVICLFDPSSRKLLRCLEGLPSSAPRCEPPDQPSGITSLAFAADGQTLAAGGTDHVIHLWETASGKQRSFGGPPGGELGTTAGEAYP